MAMRAEREVVWKEMTSSGRPRSGSGSGRHSPVFDSPTATEAAQSEGGCAPLERSGSGALLKPTATLLRSGHSPTPDVEDIEYVFSNARAGSLRVSQQRTRLCGFRSPHLPVFRADLGALRDCTADTRAAIANARLAVRRTSIRHDLVHDVHRIVRARYLRTRAPAQAAAVLSSSIRGAAQAAQGVTKCIGGTDESK